MKMGAVRKVAAGKGEGRQNEGDRRAWSSGGGIRAGGMGVGWAGTASGGTAGNKWAKKAGEVGRTWRAVCYGRKDISNQWATGSHRMAGGQAWEVANKTNRMVWLEAGERLANQRMWERQKTKNDINMFGGTDKVGSMKKNGRGKIQKAGISGDGASTVSVDGDIK